MIPDIFSDEIYGNQFTDFTEWPSDKPMDSHVAAEHCLCMCFTDSVIRIRDNCVLDVRVNPVFSARMRNNFVRIPSPDGEGTIPGSAEGYWGVHALGTHVPVEKYFATHPEYFCLRDGKRYGGYGQPCLSNPDVLQITIESVRRIMREQPDFLIYSVEQNDNQLFPARPWPRNTAASPVSWSGS